MDMFKRAVSTVLIVSLVLYVTGCTSVKSVNLTDVERPVSEWVFGVVTVTGEQVDFDEPSNDIRNDTIYATVAESPYAIGMDQVEKLRLYRTDALPTVLIVVGIVVAAVAVVAVVALASWSEGS
ncbi:MAG: hypothetical protein JSW46_16490 [Gemmatimonadota bacterium]|nr:MAG: hypothetical protein JSW46_16490 [Gemmatimonadota bacterium]